MTDQPPRHKESICFNYETPNLWIFSFPCSSVGMHTIWVPTLEHGNQARLSRIVNIKDIVMTTPREGKGLNTSCTAVTYRFVEAEEKDAANKAKKK